MRTTALCCLMMACAGTTTPDDTSVDSDQETSIDATGWMGRSYNLDMTMATWPTPEQGQLGQDLFLDVQLFVHLQEATATELTWLGFTGPMGLVQQSPCHSTFAFTPTASAQSFVAVATQSPTRIELDPGTLIIEGLTLDGQFSDDGTSLLDVALTGRLDTRELAARFGETSPSYVCDSLSSVSQSCVACEDGNPLCLDLNLAGIPGDLTVEVTVETQNEPYDPCIDHAMACPDQCSS